MNIVNYVKDKLYAGIQNTQDLYKHRPPIYEIATGILDAMMLGVAGTAFGVATMPHSSEKKTHVDDLYVTMATLFLFAIGLYIESGVITNKCKFNKLIRQSSDKKDVILICSAKENWTGAINKISNAKLKMFTDWSSSHSLVYKQVNTVDQINEEIDKICKKGQRIKVFYLGAHGEGNAIFLGPEVIAGKDLVQRDRKYRGYQPVSVEKIDFHKMDPQADIILHACSVAGRSRIAGGVNVAEWFQLYAGPTRRVFAPTSWAWNWGIHRVESGGARYKFTSLLGADITGDISYEKLKPNLRP